MDPRSHILMYERRFVATVKSGRKSNTIRQRRHAEVRPGDTLEHREWIGVPYQPGSRQSTFRTDLCASVRDIEIDAIKFLVWLDRSKYLMSNKEVKALALADGFLNTEAFFDYFKNRHGLPFHGVLIGWKA